MEPRRILVIQTAFLGDLVLTLPLVRDLHRKHPQAAITLLTRRGLADLVRDQPGVAEVREIDKRGGSLRRLLPQTQLLRRLRQARFDVVYVAHRSMRSGLLARATGAPRRIGFATAASRWGCTELRDISVDAHVAERYLALSDPQAALETPWMHVGSVSAELVSNGLRERGFALESPWVAIVPGSMWPTKRWSLSGFAGLTERFLERGHRVLLVGNSAERALCQQLVNQTSPSVVNVAGELPLTLLAALLQRATLVVGNDSGPGHVAAAVGTPVVSLFGPTTPEQGLRPYGPHVLCLGIEEPLDCRPCGTHGAQRCPLEHHRCMQAMLPDSVFRRIDEWELNPLRGTPVRPPR